MVEEFKAVVVSQMWGQELSGKGHEGASRVMIMFCILIGHKALKKEEAYVF